MTGMSDCAVTAASPSRSSGGSGCSSTVTPNSSSTGSMRMAPLTVQPQLASTRISLSVASRMARRISMSRSVPSFTLRIGYCSASSTLARIRSGVSSPMVKVDFGALQGSSPHIR